MKFNKYFTLYLERAYHGTPHYITDKFNLSFIGTGEGFQAFGWGLYFAENKNVAKTYTKDSTGRSGCSIAKHFIKNQSTEDAIVNISQLIEKYKNEKMDDRYIQPYVSALQMLKNDNVPTECGNVYSVEIDVSEFQLLDWDAKWNDQSEWVKTRLEKIKNHLVIGANYVHDSDITNETGSGIYKALKECFSILPTMMDGGLERTQWDTGHKAKSASLFLLHNGIKGIKYKDGFSRNLDDGTKNFVIFDDKLVHILGEVNDE